MIEYVSKHPTAANLMMAAFLVMGLLTVSQLKREAMPEFSPQTLPKQEHANTSAANFAVNEPIIVFIFFIVVSPC